MGQKLPETNFIINNSVQKHTHISNLIKYKKPHFQFNINILVLLLFDDFVNFIKDRLIKIGI